MEKTLPLLLTLILWHGKNCYWYCHWYCDRKNIAIDIVIGIVDSSTIAIAIAIGNLKALVIAEFNEQSKSSTIHSDYILCPIARNDAITLNNNDLECPALSYMEWERKRYDYRS